MWKTCPTSDPRSLSPTLIPSASSQVQTSLLGAVSGQVPTLHSRQVNLGDVQEVSWQLGECQQVWFHHGGGQWVRRHYRWVRQVWHHHWGLRSASGCLQLVRGQHVTKNISFVSCEILSVFVFRFNKTGGGNLNVSTLPIIPEDIWKGRGIKYKCFFNLH